MSPWTLRDCHCLDPPPTTMTAGGGAAAMASAVSVAFAAVSATAADAAIYGGFPKSGVRTFWGS